VELKSEIRLGACQGASRISWRRLPWLVVAEAMLNLTFALFRIHDLVLHSRLPAYDIVPHRACVLTVGRSVVANIMGMGVRPPETRKILGLGILTCGGGGSIWRSYAHLLLAKPQ
jgi:hypothetical protein